MGVIASTLVLMAAACTDDGTTGGEPPASTGSDSGTIEVRYVLIDDPEWQLREAIDYRAGLGPLGERDPDLDWYTEYDGPRVDHGNGSYTIPAITVSGHTAGLEERRDQIPGFEFHSDALNGRRALIAAAADDNPAVVIIELASSYTATLLTYDEDMDLRHVALRLTAADEQQWIAAGGTMLDCVPLQSECPPGE